MHRISRRNLLKTAWRRRWPRRLPACSSPPIRRPGAASSRKGRLYINQPRSAPQRTLSPSAERRAAPTRLHCPRHRGRARPCHRRGDRLRPRRLYTGAGPDPAARIAARSRPRPRLHRPRSFRRARAVRSCCSASGRCGGRGGLRRIAIRRSAPLLYAGASGRHSAARAGCNLARPEGRAGARLGDRERRARSHADRWESRAGHRCQSRGRSRLRRGAGRARRRQDLCRRARSRAPCRSRRALQWQGRAGEARHHQRRTGCRGARQVPRRRPSHQQCWDQSPGWAHRCRRSRRRACRDRDQLPRTARHVPRLRTGPQGQWRRRHSQHAIDRGAGEFADVRFAQRLQGGRALHDPGRPRSP